MSILQLTQITTQLHSAYQHAKTSDQNFKQYRLIYSDCWKVTEKLDAIQAKDEQERLLKRLTLQRLEELTAKCLKHKLQ